MHLPPWVKTRLRQIKKFQNYLKARKINTVCETLRCPNRSLCYRNFSLTFMILGNICTRNCKFCNAERGAPSDFDVAEPKRIAETVKELSLKYAVITSPTRDDLKDGGAEQFAETVKLIKKYNANTPVEVLVPDFRGKVNSVESVVKSDVDVFAHNIETIKRLYGTVRDGDYECSLSVLKTAKKINPKVIIKSGLMLGFGEKKQEIEQTLKDLKDVGCDVITIGQYLQPSKKALPVVEYIKPEIFKEIAEEALKMDFKIVLSKPLVRSSTKALETYLAIKEGRYGKL